MAGMAVAQPEMGVLRRLMQPGWIRAAWMTVAGAAFAFGLVVGIRALYGVDLFSDEPLVTVILIAAPLAFLVGIGGFDYWGRYIIGAPTKPGSSSLASRS